MTSPSSSSHVPPKNGPSSSSSSKPPPRFPSRNQPPPKKKDFPNRAHVATLADSQSTLFLYGGAASLQANSSETSSKVHWILDSGCTDHLSPFRFDFNEQKYGQSMDAIASGSCNFENKINGHWMPMEIRRVLYVLSASARLLSVSRLDEDGFKIEFANRSCNIANKQTGEIVAHGKIHDLRVNAIEQTLS